MLTLFHRLGDIPLRPDQSTVTPRSRDTLALPRQFECIFSVFSALCLDAAHGPQSSHECVPRHAHLTVERCQGRYAARGSNRILQGHCDSAVDVPAFNALGAHQSQVADLAARIFFQAIA
jgi:hypothetical protein